MAPTAKRRSIMTKEEKIARLKESRNKYSQISKAKKTISNRTMPKKPSELSQSTKLPNLTIEKAPKTAATKMTTRSHVINSSDHDFMPDPNSLAMIKSGKITMGSMRPSISGRPSFATRSSIAARPSISARRQFRSSIANEPRQSLLPLGINIFSANENERNELSEFFSAKFGDNKNEGNESLTMKMLTPGKVTKNAVFKGNLNSGRQKKIRFMENVILEQRESTDPTENPTTSSTSIDRHSPIKDDSFVPTSILSSKKQKRRHVTLGSIDDEKQELQDFEKLLSSFEKVVDEQLKSENKKFEKEICEKIEILMNKLKMITHREINSEAMNETMDEEKSPLPVLQGCQNVISTPKAVKNFREKALKLQPLGQLVNEILNSTVSPIKCEEQKVVKKARKVGLSLCPGVDKNRVLYRRRSSRLSNNGKTK